MQRVISATLFLILALLPFHAQMRGARGGGGGGFRSAPAAGSFRGAPAGGGFRSAPAGSYRAVPRPAGVVRSQAPVRRWGSNFGFGFGFESGGFPHHHRPYYFGYYGYPGYYYPYAYGYPYGYFGGYSVYDPGTNGSLYYSNAYSSDDSSYYAQQQLNAEIGSLDEQMQELRQENDSLRDYLARNNPAPVQGPDRRIPQSLQQPMSNSAPSSPPTPATVLVFNDGHRVEVQNYAIVGNTLWVLSERRSQKYAMSDLDLQKTAQENEKRGVDFTAPATQ